MRRKQQWHKEAGFTLMELAIVMAIFGITMAMVFIEYNGSERGMITQSAAYKLANIINTTRDYGRSFNPVFDSNGGVEKLKVAGLVHEGASLKISKYNYNPDSENMTDIDSGELSTISFQDNVSVTAIVKCYPGPSMKDIESVQWNYWYRDDTYYCDGSTCEAGEGYILLRNGATNCSAVKINSIGMTEVIKLDSSCNTGSLCP